MAGLGRVESCVHEHGCTAHAHVMVAYWHGGSAVPPRPTGLSNGDDSGRISCWFTPARGKGPGYGPNSSVGLGPTRGGPE